MASMTTLFHMWHYVLVLSIFFAERGTSVTDPHDVLALVKLFRQLNYPYQLKNWVSAKGADPCGDQINNKIWTGVSCEGNVVQALDFHNLGLRGSLPQLDVFQNLRFLFFTDNNFVGEIPYMLPPKIVIIDLSGNQLTGNIPSMYQSKSLKKLNFSHNLLSGPIKDDVFRDLDIAMIDLSYNNLSGVLPPSLGSLKNIHILNVEFNCLEGEYPKQLQQHSHVWIQKQCFSPPPPPSETSPCPTSPNPHPPYGIIAMAVGVATCVALAAYLSRNVKSSTVGEIPQSIQLAEVIVSRAHTSNRAHVVDSSTGAASSLEILSPVQPVDDNIFVEVPSPVVTNPVDTPKDNLVPSYTYTEMEPYLRPKNMPRPFSIPPFLTLFSDLILSSDF